MIGNTLANLRCLSKSNRLYSPTCSNIDSIYNYQTFQSYFIPPYDIVQNKDDVSIKIAIQKLAALEIGANYLRNLHHTSLYMKDCGTVYMVSFTHERTKLILVLLLTKLISCLQEVITLSCHHELNMYIVARDLYIMTSKF